MTATQTTTAPRPATPAGLSWNARYALAAHDAGWTLPSWLQMSVQMIRNGGGCAACGSTGR